MKNYFEERLNKLKMVLEEDLEYITSMKLDSMKQLQTWLVEVSTNPVVSILVYLFVAMATVELGLSLYSIDDLFIMPTVLVVFGTCMFYYNVCMIMLMYVFDKPSTFFTRFISIYTLPLVLILKYKK